MPLLLGGDSLARNSIGGLGNSFYFPMQAVSRTILLGEPSFNNLVPYNGWKGGTPFTMLPSGYPLWQSMMPLSRLEQLSIGGTKHPSPEKKSLQGMYPTIVPDSTRGIGSQPLSMSKYQNGQNCDLSYRFILPTEENVRALSKKSTEKHSNFYERPSMKQINNLMVSTQKLGSTKKTDSTIKPHASPTKLTSPQGQEKNNHGVSNSPTGKRPSSWPVDKQAKKTKYLIKGADAKLVQSYKNLEMDVANILISDIPIPVVSSNGKEVGDISKEGNDTPNRRHTSTSSDSSADIDSTDSDNSSHSDRENVCNNNSNKEKLSVALFTCQQCAVTFNTTDELLSHKAKHVTNNFTFTCNVCTQVFRSTNGLQKHVEFHAHDDHRYNCSFCFKRFANKDGLQEHIISMHMSKRPHKCTYCPKAFRDPGSLQKHVRVHTGEKPYQCNDCEKSFAEYSSLRKHLRVHTGEQPYQCKFCPKAFSISGNLQRHILIHTGERPYKCSSCSKAFNNPSHLRRHIKNLHSKLENQK